jgi:hypothetical protein
MQSAVIGGAARVNGCVLLREGDRPVNWSIIDHACRVTCNRFPQGTKKAANDDFAGFGTELFRRLVDNELGATPIVAISN